MPQRVYISHGAFIPPMVCAWCMHGPFSVPSQYSLAFEFPASMIHPYWTATITPWCPGTHSGPHARHPTAYPCVQAHSQHVTVTPYASHTVPMNPGPSRHISAPSAFGTPPACTFQPHHHVPGSTDMHPMCSHPADTPCSMCIGVELQVSGMVYAG